MPKIYRVNLGMLLHDDVVHEKCTNEIHSNLNYIKAVMFGFGETHNHNLKIPGETKGLSNLLVQAEKHDEVKVKVEQKTPDDDLHENNRPEMLQWINENTRKEVKTTISDQLQIKLETVIVKETENIERENKEPKNTSEKMKMKKLNEEVNPPEQSEKVRKSVKMIEIGPISVIKEFNVFTFHCKIQNCNYYSEDKKAFALHCEIIHKDFFNIFNMVVCNICSIKFEYKGNFATVYDIYLHIVTTHRDFFESESANLSDNPPNILPQTYDNAGFVFPFTISNETSLTLKSDMTSVGSPLPLIPLVTEDNEEGLSSEVKLLAPKLEQLVSRNYISIQTDIPMTDAEKQTRKCVKAVAAMMKAPLLKALYKCPKYDCSFATQLPMSLQEHFITHHSILMDSLVPCMYCDYKVLCSSYVIHLEVKHGHCIFGCGDCFYRTTNSYFITMHRELMHPNTEFNILDLEVVSSNRISTDSSLAKLGELVPPYNCKDDGFLSCLFKTLYFDEYLKHMEAIHHVDGLSSFSNEHELQKDAIIEGWLAKEVGPFQCRYCIKATVTHQEMGKHQAVFHAQEQCLFYYRKFVPNDTVIIPEQVNLEDSSFINHVIHLPDQIHLCNFKLMDSLLSSTCAKLTTWDSKVSLACLLPPTKDTETDLNHSSVSLEETEALSVLLNDEACLLEKSDSLCLDKQLKDVDAHNDVTVTASKCRWKGCYQTYHFQMALVNHIETNHIQLQKGEDFTCFWINCRRKLKPFANKWNLLIHMRVHSGEKPHKCPFQGCNRAFSQLSHLKKHHWRHTGERLYLCQFPNCLKTFSSVSSRSNHQRMHYDTEAYACQITGCSKKYTKPSGLTNKKNHTVEEPLEVKQNSVEKKQKVDDFMLKKSTNSLDGTKHQWTHCDTLQCKWKSCYKMYPSQTALVNHIEKNHVQLQKSGEFTCFWTNCSRNSKPFSVRQYLLIHMRVHSGEKPHKCSDCNKAFSQLGHLKKHQIRHAGERPYLCQFPNCFKSFSTSSIRDNHQRMHYGIEAYACQLTSSSKKYADPSSLQQHMKNHTVDEQLGTKQEPVENKEVEADFLLNESFNSLDEDKYQRMHCDTLQCKWKGCYQTYDSQTTLVKHVEENHIQLQIGNEFTCFWVNCLRKSEPFNTKCTLSRHMRVHTREKPYKCSFQGCNKAYSQLATLQTHQRGHTGERPYLCQFPNCFKTFVSSSNRNIHQRRHLGAEAYACQVTSCSEKCASMSSLQKHVEKHTISEKLEVKQKLVENKQKENDFIIYHI